MITEKNGSLFVDVKVVPRSGRAGAEFDGETLRLRIKSAPVDGKANAEVVETLARMAGVPKSAVEIVRGETSKQKTLKVEGWTLEAFRSAADKFGSV